MAMSDIMMDPDGGAAELLRRALAWLAEHPAELLGDRLDGTLALLRTGRPSMAGFVVLARRLAGHAPFRNEHDARVLLSRLDSELATSNARVAARAADWFHGRPPTSIVTLSWSSTVMSVFDACADRVRALHVLESRPGGEGGRTAEKAGSLLTRVTLHPDEELDRVADMADMGLIGADTLYADGSVLNKVLSRHLAARLAHGRKPLIVAASVWKRSDGPPPAVPEEDLFEVVPAELITWIATEASGPGLEA